MSQYVFGTGQLYTTPVGGGAPLRFGALQDINVDFGGDIKQLFGQYQFPLDTARGKTKIEWKASSGNIDVSAFNTLFFGQTVTANNELISIANEAASVPATPFQVTVANAATFDMDLGVVNATTGVALRQVASAPATGEYSVSAAGVYTFAAADTLLPMLFNYLYKGAATGGFITITNNLIGTTPKFQMVLSQKYDGKSFTLKLFSNVADKLSLPLKQDDYLISEMSGQAMANAANQIGVMSTTSISGGGA